MNRGTRECLIKAGWYEGRKVDITHILQTMKDLGYVIFDEYIKFMEEFAELVVVKEWEFMGGVKTIEFTTCLEDLDEFYDFEIGVVKIKDIKEKVIPIAIVFNGEFGILISETGKFYYDRGLFANNAVELWDNLLR